MENLTKDAIGTLVRFFDILAKSEQGMNSLIAVAGHDFTDDFAKLVGNPKLLQKTLEFVKDPKVFKGSLEQEANTFEADFDDSGNNLSIPQSNCTQQVICGYENSISASMERFAVESVTSSGDNDEKILCLCGKSAAMRKELKEQNSEPFDNQTVGEIVKMLSKRHGYQAKISQQFTEKTLPYVIRTDQSAVDFLTRLADRMQAHFLIKDNKFLFLRCNNLPVLDIHKHDCSSWDFTLEPHTQYSTIEASYFDRAKRATKHQTNLTAPTRHLRCCYPPMQRRGSDCCGTKTRQALPRCGKWFFVGETRNHDGLTSSIARVSWTNQWFMESRNCDPSL